MTEPGEGQRPPAGPPGVSVAWRSAAVREVAGPAADKLAADGVPPALTAKEPGLWGPDATAEAAVRLGWLDAPRVSRALLHLRDRAAVLRRVLDTATASATGSGR
jgi:glucose-6-phosphate isomerase